MQENNPDHSRMKDRYINEGTSGNAILENSKNIIENYFYKNRNSDIALETTSEKPFVMKRLNQEKLPVSKLKKRKDTTKNAMKNETTAQNTDYKKQ